MPLIAESVGRAGIAAPGLDGLAALIDGSIDPGEWVAGLRRAERERGPRRRGGCAMGGRLGLQR